MLIGDPGGQWQDVSRAFEMAMAAEPLLVVERSEKFSFGFGDVELKEISLPNIYIVYGDMRLRHHHFKVRAFDMPETIELHFSLSGNGIVDNYANGRTYNFRPNEHNIVYMPEFDGSAKYRPDEPFRFLEIHFMSKHFLELAKNTTPTMERFLEKVVKKESTDIGKESMPITLAMHQCIHEIINCGFKGGLKLLFLQAKCVELLTLQAQAFEQNGDRPSRNSVIKTAYEKECIVYAREYLQEHIADPPTLEQLAVITGINTFKLKNGFKELYDNTVFGFLSDLRLDKAKNLLRSGMAIKDIAEELGYSSVQHFGTAFKKKFGTTPGMMK